MGYLKALNFLMLGGAATTPEVAGHYEMENNCI